MEQRCGSFGVYGGFPIRQSVERPADALSDSSNGCVLDLLSTGDLVWPESTLWSGCSSNCKTIPQFGTPGSEAAYNFHFIIFRVSIKNRSLVV